MRRRTPYIAESGGGFRDRVGRAGAPSYDVAASKLAAGSHTIVAKAYDNTALETSNRGLRGTHSCGELLLGHAREGQVLRVTSEAAGLVRFLPARGMLGA